MSLEFAAIHYRAIRDRVRTIEPDIDEQTLADTVEGLTDLHEIVQAIIPLGASRGSPRKRPQMPDCRHAGPAQSVRGSGLQTAPDFTVSIRQGIPSLMVIDEDAVPKTYWEPGEPRLRRQILTHDLKRGEEVTGAALSEPQPIMVVRTR